MLRYSVIVPVYNVKEYLPGCLDSILAQDCAEYELILIDDGSTDGSGEICDRYEALYPHIRVIHQNNQGVSAARNAGISVAKGEYVLFLDSDDMWAPNFFSCIDPLTEFHPDVIEFGFRKVYDSGTQEKVCPAVLGRGESGKAYVGRLLQIGVMPSGSSCTSAYRQHLLAEYGILFPTGVRYGEDMAFRFHVLEKARSVWGIEDAPYLYQMRENSTTHALSAQSILDVLSVTSAIYRHYPVPTAANYYCRKILMVAALPRKDVRALENFLNDNKDIMKQTSGMKNWVIKQLFRFFGWYHGAKLIRFMVFVKHGDGNKRQRTSALGEFL